MGIRRLPIGLGSALVGRVSYTGDLGFEFWCDPAYQLHLFDTLMGAGADLGIRLFGSRALNSLRLEKAYGSWAREYRPVYGPVEARLDRFVAFDKPADFIGRQAAREQQRDGGRLRLCCFVVKADTADVIGDEPIWHGEQVRGWVTSGGYAHHAGVSVAMGYVDKEFASANDAWSIEILGTCYPARLQAQPLFDPEGRHMRS